MSDIDDLFKQMRQNAATGTTSTGSTTTNISPSTNSLFNQMRQNAQAADNGAIMTPRVLDNPTPYATYTTPEPQQVSTPAPVQNTPTQAEIDWGKQYGFLSDDLLKEMSTPQQPTTKQQTTPKAPTTEEVNWGKEHGFLSDDLLKQMYGQNVQPVQAPTAAGADSRLTRIGFSSNKELTNKHGTYENYLNNIVTDDYKRRAIAEANAEKKSSLTNSTQVAADPFSGAYLAWGQRIADAAREKYAPKQEESSEMTQKQKDANSLVSQSEAMAQLGLKLTDAPVSPVAPGSRGYFKQDQAKYQNEVKAAADHNFRTTQEYNDYLMRKYDLEQEEKQLETSAVGFQAARQTADDIKARYDELYKPNYGAGNIDLSATPRFDNGDGTYSTVDSMSFYDDKTGLEILIPTVVQIDGQWYHVNEEQAIEQYYRTGKYLGAFRTPEEADAYAIQLHEQQEQLFSEREKLSAQIKAAQETADKAYGQWSSGPLRNYEVNRSKFLMEYDYPQFLRENRDNVDYSKAKNILEGLDLKAATIGAGTPEYDLTIRQRDQLKDELLSFASYDELQEMYDYYAGGKNNVDSKINDIYAKMQARIEQDYKDGVDTSTDWGTKEEPGYARLGRMLREEQAKVSEEDRLGNEVGAELARRDAEGMYETTKGTSAEKLFDELAYYSVYGGLSDKSSYNKVSKLKKDLKKELEKTGKYTEQQINNAVEELSRRGNAIRTENMQNDLSLVGTGAAGIIPGIAMTVLSFATNLASIGGLAEILRSTYNGSTIRTMDPNSNLMWGVNATNALRGAVTDAVDLKVGNTDIFDELYGIGTSAIDSMIAAYIPGDLGGAALGATAAAQGMNEAARNGASIGDAFMTGIVNGVNEMLWETISIGQFKALKEAKVLTFSDFAKNMGKSFATNFSEEFMTELANVMFDYYGNLSTSNYNLAVADYMQQGFSKKDAESKVRADLAWQVVKAGVTGGLQGIIMGTTGQALALHTINQVNRYVKTTIAENDFLANSLLARQYREGSQSRSIADQFFTRLYDIIESDTKLEEKKPQIKELITSYQTQAAQLPELMAKERAEYAPAHFTEAMHKAILESVETGKENTIHMETPTETRVRDAQTEAGMSQEAANATKALLFDVVSGKTNPRLLKSVSGTILTSQAFKDTVFALTGERLTGSAADIRRQLQSIADKKANRTITIGDAPTPVQTQDNLVEPTPVQTTAPGEVNLSDIVKPNTKGETPAPAPAQTQEQNPLMSDIMSRMMGYNRAETAGTPAEIEYGNTATPDTALSDVSYNLTNESARPVQTAEAAPVNTTQRTTEAAQPAAEATVTVDGQKLTEAEFVAGATESGDITEAQAREAFRQLATGKKTMEDLDDKVRFAISRAEENAENRTVQRNAAEQGITEYQYLVQEITNILSGTDGVKVKFVSGPEMAQLNGMMDLKTGELYVNANAPAVNANAMNGISFVLGHEGLHAADESLKAQGKQTLTDRMLGWEDKDGFHPGMLQRLEAAGALTGKYAEVGRALSELNKLVAEIKETYQNYYRNTKGWSQDRIDKVITDDYIRGEVAGDLLGNLLGVNWEQQTLGFGGTKFSRPDLFKLMAGIDDQPLQAAEMTLRERLKAQKESKLKGKAFQNAYNTTQSELRSLLKDMQEALKDFTPAIDHIADSLAEDNIEDATRYSLSSLANAAGFTAVEDEETGQRYFVRTDGTRVTKVTADDIKASPIGMLVSYASERGYLGKDKAQNAANAKKQYQFFADVCTLAASNNDFAMSMQFVGSVTFTAIKANSDSQYKTTYDFKSVCVKTQACIDQMSAAMVAKKGGLTKDEILEIYRAANEIGLPVPCPECYVWNRWIGIGGLLDNMWNYQNRYGSMSFDEVKAAYDTMHDRVAAKAEEAGLSFGKAKTKLTAQITKQYQNLLDRIEKKTNQGDKVSKADQAKLEALKDTMTDVKALTWIEDVYFGGRAMAPGNISQNYAVPAEILFDLNRGAEFATQYKDAWAFRTTQGAGYGKAITPYAEASLGEGIMASAGSINTVVKDKASGKLKNIILDSNGTLTEDVKKVLDKAVKKQKAQLFRGGQRFNSTSDAANDVASDYMLAMLEMQTMNGGVQIYTKVDGAVEYLSNVGAFINQSLMPLGGGLDSNGKILDTSVGGMSPSAAFANRDKYENAGTITIGVNDEHIRAMYGDRRRDFIIPYHASGGDANVVAESRAIQDPSQGNATRVRSTDYTRTQGEKVLSDKVLQWLGKDEAEIEQIHKNRAARLAILTGKSPDMSVVRSNPLLSELYDRFHGGKWDGVTLSKGEVEKNIYPNEYWDTETTYETSGLNTETYLQYCDDLGFLHKFAGVVPRDGQLKSVTGYNQFGEKVTLTDLAYVYDEDGNKTDRIEDYFWKNLVDRRMYGWGDQYLEQSPINLTNLGADQVRDFAKYNTGRSYDQAKSARLAEQMRERFSQNAEEGQRLSLAVGQNGVDSEGNEYEFTDMPKYQDHTSAGTSLPSNAPTVYKAIAWEPGTKNLDIGGGRTEFANNYLAERDVKNNILDPYNRDADYNLKAIDSLVNEGKYDTVTCANVLNVIDSAQSRRNVILEAAKALKPDGTAYFQIYEGDKKGGGRETSKGFQVNQKTAEYLDEVRQWFNNVQQCDYNTKTGAFRPSKSGNIIVATDPKENLPKAYWEYEEGKAVRYSLSPLTQEQQKYRDLNDENHEVGSRLYTLGGSDIKRYKNTVGKDVGGQVYLHKNYAQEQDAKGNYIVPQNLLKAAEDILARERPGFEYNTIMYDKNKGTIRFDEAPDFDTASEPIAGNYVTIQPGSGSVKDGRSESIWHHKWLWVENDYEGFDVAKSWDWSKRWLNELRKTDDTVSNRGIANGTGKGDSRWREQLEYFGLPTRSNATERYSVVGKDASNVRGLDLATLMEEQGKTKEKIFEQTGWWRDPSDGKWRFEISDDQAKLRDFNALDNLILRDVLEHPNLFEQYPDIADMPISFETLSPGVQGQYVPRLREIVLSRSLLNNKEKLLSTLIHELQHRIQDIEDFTRGGNMRAVEEAKTRARKQKTSAEKRLKIASSGVMIDLKQAFNNLKKGKSAEVISPYGWIQPVVPSSTDENGLKEALYDLAAACADTYDLSAERETYLRQALLDYADAVEDYNYVSKLGKKSASSEDIYRAFRGEQEAYATEERIGMTDEDRRANRMQLPDTWKTPRQVSDIINKYSSNRYSVANASEQTAPEQRRDDLMNDVMRRTMNDNSRYSISSNNPDLQQRIDTAIQMLDNGATPSEVYGVTKLFSSNNGELREDLFGEPVWRYQDSNARNEREILAAGQVAEPREVYGRTDRRALAETTGEERNTTRRLSLAMNTDSSGKQLSPGQQEYFKNSKVRDDNGNLLVMYHGTNTPGFTVFDPKYSDDKRSLFFTSNPMMANSYTRAQNWGQDVDPYNMITEDSTAEEFNEAAKKINSPYRIVEITPEWIAERRQQYNDVLDQIRPYADELVQLAEDLYAGEKNKWSWKDNAVTIKGLKDFADGKTNFVSGALRSLLFDADQVFPKSQTTEAAQKRLRELKEILDKPNRDAERLAIASVVPESRVGDYVWEAINPNDTYSYEIGTTERGFSGLPIMSDLKTVMKSALDRVNRLEGRSFGNRYKNYINLQNPYILDAGTHITGPHNIEIDMNGEGDIRVKVLETDEYGDEKVVFKQTFDNTDDGHRQLKELIGDEAFGRLLEFSEESKQKERKYHSDLSDEEYKEYIESFYPEAQSPIYIRYNDYFGDRLDTDIVRPGRWNQLKFNGEDDATTREVAEWAQKNGYDGVIFKNMKDTGGYAANDPGPGTVAIAFSSNQVKSTDNLNPTEDPDIRYSLSMNQTDSNTDAKRNAQIQDIVRNVMANAPQQTTTQGRDTSVGAARFGFTNQVVQDFVDWQRAAKDHHTISDEQLNNTTFNRAQRGAIQYRKTVDKTGAVSSRAAQTIRNAPTTTDAVAQSIDQAVASGEFKHIPYGDQAALKDATKAIERNGWNDEYVKYKANVDNGITSKKNTVMGIALYNNAVTAGDTYAALDIAALMIKNASNTGASLQAQRLLNNLGPDGKLYMAVRGIENIADSIRKLYPGKTIDVSKSLLQAYRDALVADDKAAIETAKKDIYQEIANQLPADWKEQFNNWRYMAMLTNPATHFRNVLGNAGFAVPRLMKQAIKAGLERAKYGRAGEGSNRTTTILNLFSAADRSRFAAGMKDYNDVVDLIQSGGKQTGPKDEVEKLRTIFHIKDHELKGLEAIRKGNTTALDWEDTLFSRPAYAEALASYLKARGIDGADYAMGNISAQDKLAAQKHAILEAQKATYRDRNQFSDLVASIGKNARRADATTAQKIAGVAGEAILPFKRTPANIMARAWEYSPAEFINVLFSDIGKIRRAQASTRAAETDSDGSEEALRAINDAKAAEAEMVTDMFDHIASATTGTLLLVAGAFLRHMGILHGGDDDDEDQAAFDKLQGQQEYSINIGNKNYTLDWLAPEVLPMFTGVALYDKLIDRDDEDGNGIIGDLSNAMLGLTEPMLNMSMLSSVSDLISNIKNLDQAEQIPAIAKNIGLNYLSQYVPTLSGKIESISSTPNRTSTYIDKESPLGSNEQYFLGRLSNKIPGWDYNQITYYDAWGRPQENGNVLQRAVANLVSPGYLRKDASTPYDEELQRLYDVNHEFKVLPQRATQSQKVDKTFLTAEEYELYTKTQGETQYQLIGELLNSSAYKKMTDAEKAKAIGEVYTEAKIAAANAVRDLRGVEVEASDSAKAGLNPVTFTTMSSVYDNAETPSGYEKTSGGKTPKWAKMLDVINDTSFSTKDRLAYVNAMSGRTAEYKTLDEAKEYYEGEKEKDRIQPEWYKTASDLYKNAVTPDGYNTTESGNTPTWAKMLSILDDKSLSKDQKLKFINEKSGLKNEFKTLDEARKHYDEQKKKNKKK